MKTIIKIPRHLLEQAQKDLLRPSKFSYERVGFFSTRRSKRKLGVLVHCIAYNPVNDDHYIIDPTVGVRIGPKAITAAMARAINDSVGQIHVHYHGGAGLPHPSTTDSHELPPLLKSLHNANYAQVHGWMVLGDQDAWSEILIPGESDTLIASPVSIIGFPTVVNHRAGSNTVLRKRQRSNARYNRQSFLGFESDRIISEVIVGVVGLGGGGSHIIQQLAHIGFKNFILCDPDRISKSNLNRLVGGTLADIRAKRLKVDIAERTIRRLHKDASVVKHAKKWEDVNQDLIECDLIIGCVDKFWIRRDLEAFCRRHMIPYLDLGMDVHKLLNEQYEIHGQVIISMPGEPCMKCMGFLTEKVLAEEASEYGAAGEKPQVVWSNGLLCSAAVGIVVDLITDWSKAFRNPVFLSFKGSELLLTLDKRLSYLPKSYCCHFPLNQIGDPLFMPL